MIDNIKKLAEVLKQTAKSNDQKYKEFHEFHKWLIENIDEAVCEEIGTVNEVAEGKGLLISLLDYNWWNEQYLKNKNLKLKPLSEIKRLVYTQMLRTAKTEQLGAPDKAAMLKMIDEQLN